MAKRGADRTRFVENAQRQNMFGGTFGNPILKNKLFNFFSIEKMEDQFARKLSTNGSDARWNGKVIFPRPSLPMEPCDPSTIRSARCPLRGQRDSHALSGEQDSCQ